MTFANSLGPMEVLSAGDYEKDVGSTVKAMILAGVVHGDYGSLWAHLVVVYILHRHYLLFGTQVCMTSSQSTHRFSWLVVIKGDPH